ncbi:HAD-superfamily phosphatase, subfamily IIIC/FkbH-like domain-containing protein [Chryseobacterium oranimense]|uniref:HAD-superfamily phosphatase, subfamily IIIC/FkbH-like domain-containing protein n=1 Tax=Chryseobacterium oranimense TaxID=421058 RepID=A0A1M5P8G1_9FLAO|nr:HAD-IIIC family phosphatase [Chryseobacterium oranimense]SHG98042.1 HAD-superfamily phosphatase, subfamily IIIC/FkbH-like domain-containing protein [Chryseobacterium oranimense]
MYKTFSELKKELRKDISGFKKIRVALLGDTATQFLNVALKGTAVNDGFEFEIFEADFGQISRQILDPTSEYYEFNPDYTIIFESSHKLLNQYYKSYDTQAAFAENKLSYIEDLYRNIQNRTKSRVIYCNFPVINNQIFGNFSNKVESSFVFQLNKLNYLLSAELAVKNDNFFIADILSIQNKWGRDFMFSPNIYVNTEMVISLDALPIVAHHITSIIASLEGKFKKCLILDLDNTTWGGIIGDDGLEKIQIGSLGIGKAFTEFQYWVKALQRRGVILAVCSKNDEDKAKEPFEKHPDMVLKMDDIAVFVANWDNKADNIRKIQSILNIGFDSMVFLDDNPFERNIVRENLPEVCVPELPEDPAEYLEYLYGLNLFETSSFSENDAERTRQYQVEAQRAVDLDSFTNVEDFLKSMNMTSDVKSFDNFSKPRVSQLTQRSNQFNLRTVRYTEQDVDRLINSEEHYTLSFTLEDKYGDNGLICVIVLEKKDPDTIFIDTWLMSCRVLKRGMEDFTLNTIVETARKHGFKNIVGEYLPTAKNQMVEDHYERLGFEKENDKWVLNVDDYQLKEVYINNKI